jgi:hypothetical protein
MVPSLSLHCLALYFCDSVFSLSLHSDLVLKGGEGGREWLASHIAASGAQQFCLVIYERSCCLISYRFLV